MTLQNLVLYQGQQQKCCIFAIIIFSQSVTRVYGYNLPSKIDGKTRFYSSSNLPMDDWVGCEIDDKNGQA